MNNHNIGRWRRVFKLSATFLLCFLVTMACRKKDSDIGLGSLNQDELLAGGGIDTFSLKTYSELDDTVITKNSILSVLGSYNDPVFGKMNAEIYTQIRLTASNPVFEASNKVIIDSFVLSLKYNGFTGKSDVQTFEVYELNDSIRASADEDYYTNSTITLKSTNLVMASSANQKMLPTKQVVVDSTLQVPQLRLKLDTNLARTFMNDANSSGGHFSSAEAFSKYFKGLCIRTNNPVQSSGQGGVGAFALTEDATRLTIYYRVKQDPPNQNTTVSRQFIFKINSNAQRFNRVTFDRSGSKLQNVLDNNTEGQKEFYAQAFGTRAAVQIPGIKNLPKNTIIHRAELFLPVQYQFGSAYSMGTEVTLAANVTTAGLSLLNFGIYSEFRKGFVIDVRNFVQQVVSGKIENQTLLIAPKQFISSADRIIFNGKETSNKLQPKLTLIYTEF